METTVSGKVGYNYALNIPNSENMILFGFVPNNKIPYEIAAGWTLKLPYLNIDDEESFYQSDNGYTYLINSNYGQFSIINFPSEHQLISNVDNSGYILEKPYGVKEYFSQEGFITKKVDEFGNTIEYVYNDGVISEIIYSDGSLIIFEKLNSTYTTHINYSKDGIVDTIANLNFKRDLSGLLKLTTIKENNSEIQFNYSTQNNMLLLNEYAIKDDYKRTITYENVDTVPRIKASITYYNDGIREEKKYFYNSQNKLKKLIDGDVAEILYNYTQDDDGNLTINTIKKYNGKESSSSEIINKFGQTTKYINNGTILKLKYNKYDKVSKEIENDMSISYSYTKQGKVAQSNFSNGDIVKFDYYNDGKIKKITSNLKEISYMPSGEVSEIKIPKTIKNTGIGNNAILSDDSGVYVTYEINNNVGDTNFLNYYHVSAWGFNCYTSAIVKGKNSK